MAYVDYDEIDSLLKGIDSMSMADRNSIPLTNFEAVYETKGALSVFTYSTGNGIHLAVFQRHMRKGNRALGNE
jgi:hypothetical protein